jgi:hypothetical protein
VVKTGRIEVKPKKFRHQESEVSSQGQKKKMDGDKKVGMKLTTNVYCAGLFSEDHVG